MAFTSLTTGSIATGEPVTNSMLTQIKTNLDDLDTRVTNLDLTVAFQPLMFEVLGNYSWKSVTDSIGILKTTIGFNITITGVFLIIKTPGSSSSTEIDLKVSRAGGASYNSVMTTKPSVAYSAGADAISTNGVVNPSYVNCLAGDILRLDVTAMQAGSPDGFIVRIDYLKT